MGPVDGSTRRQLLDVVDLLSRKAVSRERLAANPGLRRLLAQLPPAQRVTLVLRYVDDLSEHDIALLLGLSRAAVTTSAARGIARLRALSLAA